MRFLNDGKSPFESIFDHTAVYDMARIKVQRAKSQENGKELLVIAGRIISQAVKGDQLVEAAKRVIKHTLVTIPLSRSLLIPMLAMKKVASIRRAYRSVAAGNKELSNTN